MTHGKDCEEAWCSCNHPNLKVVIETEEYIYWEFTEALRHEVQQTGRHTRTTVPWRASR